MCDAARPEITAFSRVCASVTFCFQPKARSPQHVRVRWSRKSRQGEDLRAPERKRHPCENGKVPKNVVNEKPDDADATERRKASFHCDLFASDHLRPLRTSLMCTTPSTQFRARHPRRRAMSSETETSPTKGLLRVPPQRGRWLGRSKRTLCYILFRDTNTEFRSTWRATEEEEKTLRAPRRQHHGGEPRVSQSEGLVRHTTREESSAES